MREPREQQPTSTAGTNYLGVGLSVVGSTVLFLYAGIWADARLGSKPWLTVIGAFVGAAAGFYYLFRRLAEDTPQRAQKPERKG